MDNELQKAPACSICGKEFKNKAGVSLHTLRSHPAPKQPEPEVKQFTPMDQTAHTPEPKPEYDINKYKQLPVSIIDHLKITFGNWLNYFEIGQEWKEDFGGYGLYIKVPRQFSTEWKEVEAPRYDNATMKMVGTDKKAIEDIRWKPLKDMADAKKWIDLVKKHIIDHAFQKGLQLPSTNVGYDEHKLTKDQYESLIAGAKQPV